MADSRAKAEQRPRAVSRNGRDELALNLRLAFPLGDTGSFTGLLRAIDERAG